MKTLPSELFNFTQMVLSILYVPKDPNLGMEIYMVWLVLVSHQVETIWVESSWFWQLEFTIHPSYLRRGARFFENSLNTRPQLKNVNYSFDGDSLLEIVPNNEVIICILEIDKTVLEMHTVFLIVPLILYVRR